MINSIPNSLSVGLYLGYVDVRKQYARTFMGPIWITLGTLVFILAFSVIAAEIFDSPQDKYLTYFGIGHILFIYLQSSIVESCTAVSASSILLLNKRISVSSLILRVISKNMIIFFHNLLGLLFALIAIKGSISIHWLSLLLSVTLGSIFLWGFGTALAIASARFRDVPLAVQSLLTILFFLTPIIWSVDQVSSTDLIGLIYLNPFAVFLDLSRLPFNLSLDPINFKAYAISLISLTVGTFMLHKFSSKICYWL